MLATPARRPRHRLDLMPQIPDPLSHSPPGGKSKFDLTGQRFGRLVVIEQAETNGSKLRWRCQCDCGKIHCVEGTSLRKGGTQSCGCLARELTAARARKHGKSNTRLYWVWAAMLDRCNNPKCPAFKNYGGRGIKVCARWLKFENFLTDMGERPSPQHTVDRIYNDGNYEPGNCTWRTRAEQSRNMRSNRRLTLFEETYCLKDWSERTEIPLTTIWSRLHHGWPSEYAFTLPIQPGVHLKTLLAPLPLYYWPTPRPLVEA
jgi:hypothetical protein